MTESAADHPVTSEASFVRTRDGIQQRVRRWEPEGTPRASIVIHHGLGEHSGRYERTGQLLADAGFDVVAFDCRGHGETEGRMGHVDRLQQFLDDIEDQLASSRDRTEKVVLFGHSMGGLLACRYAVGDRPQPDYLILSAPALDAAVPSWQKKVLPFVGKVIPKLPVDTPVKRGQLTRDTKVEDAYFADPLVFSAGTSRLASVLLGAQAEAKSGADRIRVPTLVIHGGKDELVSPAFSEPLARLEGVERKVFPTLRHETMNEPEGPEVVAFVLGWLDRHLSS
jgi:alpha-beta hydrolase superfamily lysophospholipase